MPSIDLNRRSVIALSTGAILAAALSARPLRAENVLNFPLKADPRLAKDASVMLLVGATAIMSAIQLSETDREKANAQLKLGIADLEKSRALFIEVQKRLSPTAIDMKKVTLGSDQISRIVSVHKLELPKSMDRLAQVAVAEVTRFLDAAKEMSFENVQKARNGTLLFSTAVNRLLDVGVLVSALADAEVAPR